MKDLILSQYQTQSEFEPDEAAALWCEVVPYSSYFDAVSSSSNRAFNDTKFAETWLPCTTDDNRLYYKIYCHIKGFMKPTNAHPRSRDKISRKSLIDIALKFGERPQFLFPDSRLKEETENNSQDQLQVSNELDSTVIDRLNIIQGAVNRFWAGVTEESWEDATTRRGKDKDSVQAWLVGEGLGKTQAKYVDVLIRPKFAAKGGNVKIKVSKAES
ncbi:MAG: hypothetical protein JKY87_03885 [Mariprofundus sp.]|nr:hypothetical protein [Mariprofundus sp.]